jgi:hypothetical protein
MHETKNVEFKKKGAVKRAKQCIQVTKHTKTHTSTNSVTSDRTSYPVTCNLCITMEPVYSGFPNELIATAYKRRLWQITYGNKNVKTHTENTYNLTQYI